MVKKPVFYTEIAYFLGLFLLAWGTALTVWGDFGLSMVVAPAYIIHVTVSKYWPWFSFGVAEYAFQAVILIVMVILLRKARWYYLLSFATAVLYGILLDAGTSVFHAVLPATQMEGYRLAAYIVGDLMVCAGVSMMFKTYIPPEAYELFVKEIGSRTGIKLHIFKTAYDCCSLIIAVGLSYILLGNLEGIGIGTVVCAFLNGSLIKGITGLLEKNFEFRDLFAFRVKLEGSEGIYE